MADDFLNQRFHYGGLAFYPSARVVWAMTPKAASTSLRHAFGEMFGEAVKHKKTKPDYLKLLGELAEDKTEWLRVVSIRCPYERFWSFWRYFTRRKRARWVKHGMKFDAFAGQFSEFVANDTNAEIHARPNSYYLGLAPTIVIRCESLQHDVEALCKIKNIEAVQIPHLNRSPNLTGETCEEVYQRCSVAREVVERVYFSDLRYDRRHHYLKMADR